MQLLLSKCTPMARQILELNFGINGQTPMSYSAIAKRLSVHEETVGAIKKRTLEALRTLLASMDGATNGDCPA